jgi:amino acid efflux transporter
LKPFAPHGFWSVGSAASLLFFSFAGWEAVTHLSGEFHNPARDLRRVAALTLVIVAVLYIGLSLTSVLVLGPELENSPVPLSLLLQAGVGRAASAVTATVAALLALGTMTAYLAGASRLGAALARDGALPSWMAKGNQAGEVPRRSLAVLGVLSVAVSVIALTTGASLGSVMLGASACFIAVTVAGLVAGARLLPTGRPVWFGAVLAAVVMAVVLAFSEWFLLVPLVLGVAAVLYSRRRGRADPVEDAVPGTDEPLVADEAAITVTGADVERASGTAR